MLELEGIDRGLSSPDVDSLLSPDVSSPEVKPPLSLDISPSEVEVSLSFVPGWSESLSSPNTGVRLVSGCLILPVSKVGSNPRILGFIGAGSGFLSPPCPSTSDSSSPDEGNNSRARLASSSSMSPLVLNRSTGGRGCLICSTTPALVILS